MLVRLSLPVDFNNTSAWLFGHFVVFHRCSIRSYFMVYVSTLILWHSTALSGIKLSKDVGLMKSRTWLFFGVGAITMLLLQLHFTLFWNSYYAEGAYPPFFTGSTRSLEITLIVLFILPFVALWFVRGKALISTLALWLGVMFSAMIIWLASEQLRRDSNMWPIDLVLLSIMTGIPLFLGCISQIVIQRVLGYLTVISDH